MSGGGGVSSRSYGIAIAALVESVLVRRADGVSLHLRRDLDVDPRGAGIRELRRGAGSSAPVEEVMGRVCAPAEHPTVRRWRDG